jgi:hypothetical protein
MSDQEVRKRGTAVSGAPKATASSNPPTTDDRKAETGLGLLEIGRIIVAGLILVFALSWFITGESLVWNWRQLPTLLGSAKRYMVCAQVSPSYI